MYGTRCRTIGVSHKLITEENFEEALSLAQQKDLERAAANKAGTLHQLPPLHGIPFSVKDQFFQKGKLATMGCAYLATDEHECREDAVAVQLFREAGGIPLARGNVP